MHTHDPIETAAKRSGNSDAVEEVLSALRRRGPNALDVLLESLETEKDANANLISKIRGCMFEEGGYNYRTGGGGGGGVLGFSRYLIEGGTITKRQGGVPRLLPYQVLFEGGIITGQEGGVPGFSPYLMLFLQRERWYNYRGGPRSSPSSQLFACYENICSIEHVYSYRFITLDWPPKEVAIETQPPAPAVRGKHSVQAAVMTSLQYCVSVDFSAYALFLWGR